VLTLCIFLCLFQPLKKICKKNEVTSQIWFIFGFLGYSVEKNRNVPGGRAPLKDALQMGQGKIPISSDALTGHRAWQLG